MTNSAGGGQGGPRDRLRDARRLMDDAVRQGSDAEALRAAGAELLAAEEGAQWDESPDRAREEPRVCANCGVESTAGPEGGCPNCGQPMRW